MARSALHEARDVGDGNVPQQRGGQLRLGDACGAKEHRNGDLDAVVDGAEVVDENALNLTLGLGDAVEKHGALAFGILRDPAGVELEGDGEAAHVGDGRGHESHGSLAVTDGAHAAEQRPAREEADPSDLVDVRGRGACNKSALYPVDMRLTAEMHDVAAVADKRRARIPEEIGDLVSVFDHEPWISTVDRRIAEVGHRRSPERWNSHPILTKTSRSSDDADDRLLAGVDYSGCCQGGLLTCLPESA